MAVAFETLTVDPWEIVNVAPGSPVAVKIRTNTDGAIIDAAAGKIFLGTHRVNTKSKVDISLPVTNGATNPTGFQYTADLEYVDEHSGKRKTWNSGWFSFTASANLASVVEEQYVPPTYLTTVTQQLDAKVAEAEVARAGAEQAKADAEALIISDLGTTDGQTRALIEAPASQTAQALSASYAAKGVPIYAGERVRAFDPVTGTYNWKASNTRRLLGGIAKARAGKVGRLLLIGDSEIAGMGATPAKSIPGFLMASLDAAGVPIGGPGFINAQPGGTIDPRWAFTGSWSNLTGFRQWNEVGATATLTLDRPCTSVRVIFTEGSGSFTCKLDDGPAVAVTPPAGAGMDIYIASTALPDTTHTITITSTSATGRIAGVVAERGIHDSGSGLRVSNVGQSGTSTAAWTSTSPVGAYMIGVYALFGATPDAVICKLGVNDLTSNIPAVTVATYKANMEAIRGRYPNSDFVLMSSLQPTQPDGATTQAAWENYVAAMYDLADSLDVPLVDTHWSVYGSAAIAGPLGLTAGDPTPHPSDVGYAREADILSRLLTG